MASTPTESVAAAVARAKAAESPADGSPALGAWTHVVEAPEAVSAPSGSLVRGLPVGVKDGIVTAGLPTTAGSQMLAGWLPPYSATVVERLASAGAVVLGKLAQDEFAMGATGETCAWGPTRNPWDLDRVPGGSSSGSAAAVAAGTVPMALGSDTGGSVRQPASLCGVVGLKPTYGRVSRYGLVAYASSLDQVGPIGRDVASTAALYAAIAGPDGRDATSLPDPLSDAEHATLRQLATGGTDSASLSGRRVGLLVDTLDIAGVAPDVAASVQAAADTLRAAGAEVVEVHLPDLSHAVPVYYVLATAEAASNLSRFDGVRFGHRTASDDATTLEVLHARSRAEGFGAEVTRRILLGTHVLSSGYYDAYYGRAQKARTVVRRQLVEGLAGLDALMLPTSPVTAPLLDAPEVQDDPVARYLLDVFTVPASLAGLPALSLPSGFDGAGLPIGLQLIGPALSDVALLQLAGGLEAALGVSGRRSPLAEALDTVAPEPTWAPIPMSGAEAAS